MNTTVCRKEPCFYCDAALSPRHEHDHAPIPKRSGGTTTFCVCLNCHDLKDRQNIEDWPSEFFGDAVAGWKDMNAATRIFLMKATAIMYDCDCNRRFGAA